MRLGSRLDTLQFTTSNNPLLTLLQNVIAYASQGPQELCLAIAVPGFFVAIFGRPISEAKPKTTAKRGAKHTKQGKAKTKTTTPRKAKAKRPKSKANSAKPKPSETPRSEAQSLSAEQMNELETYYTRRRIWAKN